MNAKQYRKKPVVIEAVRLTSATPDGEIIEFLAAAQYDFDEYALTIRTLEGDMLARPGDWIIKGVKGEFYPCKPDIFDATYELVTLPVGRVRSKQASAGRSSDQRQP